MNLTPLRVCALILVAPAIAGCGGAGSGNGRAKGRATFTVKWPASTRLIPAASNSIVVTVTTAGGVQAGRKILPRPSGGGNASTTFDSLPVGTLSASAVAFPNADGSGVAQAAVTGPLVIADGQNTSFSLSMLSTITHIDVTPATPSVAVGSSVTLMATPRDATGAAVLVVPANISWSVDKANIATINAASGKVTGVAAGSCTVSVHELESGAPGSASVTVTGSAGGGATPIKVSISWPVRSRAISAPGSALSVTIVLAKANPDGTDFRFEVDRDAAPAAYTQAYTSPTSAQPGTFTLAIRFYANAAASGSVVGTANAQVTINADGTGIGNIAIGTVIQAVQVQPDQTVPVGATQDLNVTCSDVNGATVAVTPGSIFPAVTSGASYLTIVGGRANGTAAGTATVTAQVDGVTSPPVPVGVEAAVTGTGTYRIADLGTLGGSSSAATSINTAGQAAGYSSTVTGAVHGFIWQDGTLTDVGTLGGQNSIAYGLNGLGQVVGASDTAGGRTHAMLFDYTGIRDLGLLPGQANATANGINVLAQAAGVSGARATLWQNGAVTAVPGIPTLFNSVATSINAYSQVVGYLAKPIGGTLTYQGFENSGSSVQYLGTLGGASTQPLAISDSGLIVGWSDPASPSAHHAFLFNGTMQDLGVLPGLDRSAALGINAQGQAVGNCDRRDGTGSVAFIYTGGQLLDLNALMSGGAGWLLTKAAAINSLGQIAGTGSFNGATHAFLLTPQ